MLPRLRARASLFRTQVPFRAKLGTSPLRTSYFEHIVGVAHYFYDWLVFRPEVRLDYTSGAKAIDNGTKREMFTFSADLIIRF
jgi:hypothetical protein